MDKTCFAYTSAAIACEALADNSGCGPNCPFRKSVTEHEAARLTADQRLARLPEEQQRHIADTYYKGNRPWLETARKAVRV